MQDSQHSSCAPASSRCDTRTSRAYVHTCRRSHRRQEVRSVRDACGCTDADGHPPTRCHSLGHVHAPHDGPCASLASRAATCPSMPTWAAQVSELRSTDLGPRELRGGGFSPAELREGGFKADELKAAGCPTKELREGGFAAVELKEGGFTLHELKSAGCACACACGMYMCMWAAHVHVARGMRTWRMARACSCTPPTSSGRRSAPAPIPL